MKTREADIERRKRIENYLDRGMGSVWMAQPEIGRVVENALLYFDGVRYKCLPG